MGTKAYEAQYRYSRDLRQFPTEIAANLARRQDDQINEFVSWSKFMYDKYEKLLSDYDDRVRELRVCEQTVKLLQVTEDDV